MEQSDRQFWHIARAFLVRYNEYNREKGTSPLILEEFDHSQAKMLSQQELKEAAITKLTSIELKSDYHNLILLAFLQDLAKWSNQYFLELADYPAPLQAILTQTIQVLSNQQQFHTIVAKQNELISTLLPLSYTISHLDQFKTLYRRLKDVKDYFPLSIREHQKKCFMTATEEVVDRASKLKNIKVIEFIFGNIFNELEVLEENHEFITQRLKIMKKIVKYLWIFHQDIIFKLAYLLMKLSYQIPNNPHLYSHLLPIYDYLIDKLMERPAITALLLFKHLILNNISILLSSSNSSCIVLQGLLNELSKVFVKKRLEYFMRNYDWNYLEVPIVQQSLNMLYQYCENRTNQKKIEHELVKTYLNRIHTQIKYYLEQLRGVHRDDSKWKFYELKRKQYQEIVEEMNERPKKIFKEVENIKNPDVRECIIQKYVKLIKKTSHLNNRSMIDIFSTDHPVSAQLFAAYAEIMLKQCKQHNLEEFIRLFTSNFFLTGESQQIARVLDTITQFYYTKQEEAYRTLRSSDATYTFANAILILNTDLHNPKNQEKISEESFLKMCKKINEGEDIPTEILRKTYNNIKKNKINTFRDRGNMLGISVSNWLALCTDYEALPLSYYDPELEALDEPCLQYFIHDLLSSIIDEKQTAKLQLLVERFIYDDKVFECEIIQVIRKVVDKKPHLPLHILEKIFELANFKHNKPSEKTLSYYWLAANLIITFNSLIPTNIICEFLVLTWDIRTELQDNMHLRQTAEIKRVKQCIKAVNKRQSKKSIMEMFSSFLSFKESDDQMEPIQNGFTKRNNFKAISNNVFDIVKYQENHKKLAIQFLIKYIHNEESKVYEEFLSCLFLVFNLLYIIENCEEAGQDLFYELLGAKESSITKRLANLGKKDAKLFNILSSYCRFWILKLLLKEYCPLKTEIKENNAYQYMLNKSLECLQKVDKEILHDLMKEVQLKSELHPTIVQSFEKSIKKVYASAIPPQIQAFLDKFKKQKALSNESQKEIQKTQIKQEKNQEIPLSPERQKETEQPLSDNKVQECKNQPDKQIEKVTEKSIENLQEQPEQPEQPEEIKVETKQIQETFPQKSNNQTKIEEKSHPEPSKEEKEEKKISNVKPVHEQTITKETIQSKKAEQIADNQSKQAISKKKSVQNLQDYIDPDAVIDQIDRQIEHHRKTEESTPTKPKEKQEIKTEQEQQAGLAKKPSQQSKQEDNSPSIPVIMF